MSIWDGIFRTRRRRPTPGAITGSEFKLARPARLGLALACEIESRMKPSLNSAKGICCAGFFLFLCCVCNARTPAAFEQTLAPDKHTIIFQGKEDCHFVDLRSKKNLGHIPHTSGNEDIVASWCPDSSKVAIVKYYGSKLCCLQLLRRTATGKFVELNFEEPRPMDLYEKRHGKFPFEYDGSTAPMDGVGPWASNDKVHLISGESHFAYKESLNLFVTFDAQFKGATVQIRNIQMHELMSDNEAEKFKPWSESKH